MSEKMTAILFQKDSNRPSEDEWLGPESHMPNLSRELRRREPRKLGLSFGWIAGAMFVSGAVVGCLAVRLLDRRS